MIGNRKVGQDGWRHIFLTGAVLPGALLFYTNLTNVRLAGADLTGANLIGADLTNANLVGAFHDPGKEVNFTGADLSGADFTDANLPRANYAGANLNGTRWPGGAPAPEGWKLDTGSGRLKRAGTDSGPAEAD